MKNTIYYLPGWSGRLRTGLGQGLLGRGYDITGRETRDDFAAMTFTDQVTAVAEDLQAHFWRDDARVVANSFGAYLFLHAQLSLTPFPGKVLLLSPIVGGFADEATGRVFSPPKENVLIEAARAGQYPPPPRCQVHTGSDDWQSHPVAVSDFFGRLGIEAVIAQGRGHMLGEDYVGPLLDQLLPLV